MTITLELPPETEACLLAQAESRGLSLDVYLRTVIVKQATANDTVKPSQGQPLEDPDRAIDEVFDTVELPLGVGQGVMSRENWYR
jgi:hypothetical protein